MSNNEKKFLIRDRVKEVDKTYKNKQQKLSLREMNQNRKKMMQHLYLCGDEIDAQDLKFLSMREK